MKFLDSAESRKRHEDKHSFGRIAPKDRLLLASCQLFVCGANLSLRQPAAEATADARGCEAHAAGTLGHDARAEFHLRALEPGYQKIRPRHDLRLRAWAWRTGRRRQYIS